MSDQEQDRNQLLPSMYGIYIYSERDGSEQCMAMASRKEWAQELIYRLNYSAQAPIKFGYRGFSDAE